MQRNKTHLKLTLEGGPSTQKMTTGKGCIMASDFYPSRN